MGGGSHAVVTTPSIWFDFDACSRRIPRYAWFAMDPVVSQFSSLFGGGAANAARALHDRMVADGSPSRFYYNAQLTDAVPPDASYEPLELPAARWSYLTGRRRRRFGRAFDRMDQKYEHLSTPVHPSRLSAKHPAIDRADVLHLHWISEWFDHAAFFASVGHSKPLVWTLHDMNPMTGGCHFSDGCQRFTDTCAACPQMPNDAKWLGRDAATAFQQIKRDAYSHCDMHLVFPSRWLMQQAHASDLLRDAASMHHIPYGFNLTELAPVNRDEACHRLGLDPNRRWVAFGADNHGSRRKGMFAMADIMRRATLNDPSQKLSGLVFGGDSVTPELADGAHVVSAGKISGAEQKRWIFGAADAVVVPSLEDNSPLIGLEAMACGRGVIGYAAGGIAEYVRDDATGSIVDVGDWRALADRIVQWVNDPDRVSRFGVQSRQVMLREHDDKQQSDRYRTLYRDVIDAGEHRCDNPRRRAA